MQIPPSGSLPPGDGYYGQPVVVYNQGTNGLAIFSGFVPPMFGAFGMPEETTTVRRLA
jgi:hypothetical protein